MHECTHTWREAEKARKIENIRTKGKKLSAVARTQLQTQYMYVNYIHNHFLYKIHIIKIRFFWCIKNKAYYSYKKSIVNIKTQVSSKKRNVDNVYFNTT